MATTTKTTTVTGHMAWDYGYGMAVIGCTATANNWKSGKLAEEWLDGFKQAIADGVWGTHPDYKSK